jgi:hypothetical protein
MRGGWVGGDDSFCFLFFFFFFFLMHSILYPFLLVSFFFLSYVFAMPSYANNAMYSISLGYTCTSHHAIGHLVMILMTSFRSFTLFRRFFFLRESIYFIQLCGVGPIESIQIIHKTHH